MINCALSKKKVHKLYNIQIILKLAIKIIKIIGVTRNLKQMLNKKHRKICLYGTGRKERDFRKQYGDVIWNTATAVA